jgi:hypothetical protein
LIYISLIGFLLPCHGISSSQRLYFTIDQIISVFEERSSTATI